MPSTLIQAPVTGWLIAATALALALPSGRAAAGDMVLSQFVYRDVDRDGIYELGEPPMAGVPVRLTRDGHEPVVVATNLAGFANFVMSPGTGMIPGPGDVRIEVIEPEEFTIPGGSAPHDTTIRSLPDAPAGLVAASTPPFVGLAPKLGISIAAAPGEEVSCISDGIEWGALGEGADRYCPAAPGLWTVSWSNGRETDVEVSHWPLRLPRPATGAAHRLGGTETIISFDDLITSNNLVEVPAGVGGLMWRNVVATHRMYYEGAGYINGTTSGEFAAYNSSGHTAVFFDDEPFDLLEMKLTAAWPDTLRAPIRVEAFRNGAPVAQDRFFASLHSPLLFSPGWTGIDEVRISHGTYWQVVIDDIVIRR